MLAWPPRYPLSSVLLAVLLTACATKVTPLPGGQIDPPPLVINPGDTGPSGKSVLPYSETAAIPGAGNATHVTITDTTTAPVVGSDGKVIPGKTETVPGKVLYEGSPTPNQTYSVPVPKDGKLIITTHWSNGPPTRQEINEPPPTDKSKGVAIRWLPDAKTYTTATPIRLPSETPTARVPLEEKVEILKGPLGTQYGSSARGGVVQLTPKGKGGQSASPHGTPTYVTVRDEAGNILEQGPTTDDGYYDLEIGGGRKLFVTTKWSDGQTTLQELTFTNQNIFPGDWDWGDSVGFYLDPNTNRYVMDAPERPLLRAIDVAAIVGKLSNNPVTAGVNVGADTPLHTGPDEVNFSGFVVGAEIKPLWNLPARIELAVYSGDDSTQSESSSGIRGWLYQGGESNGSGGLATTAPTRASVTTKISGQELSLRLSKPCKTTPPSKWWSEYGAYWRHIEHEHDGSVQIVAANGPSSTDDQQVTENELGISYGVRGRHNFGSGFSFWGGVRLNVGYRRGEYDGEHHYVCSTCIAGNRDFTQSTSDSDNGFAWSGTAGASFGYRFSRTAELSFGYDYLHQDKALVLVNRVGTGTPAPHFEEDSTRSQRVRLGLRYAF